MEEIDLIRDWHEILDSKMSKYPLIFDENILESEDEKYIQYINFYRKTNIPGVKYNVHFSKEFIIEDRFKKALNNIVLIMKNGKPWIKYLSTSAYNLKKKKVDKLFNNWGILHFHLGESRYKKDNRFVERTGPLAFVFFNENDAYFLKIYHHREKPWYEKELLQILYDNWPHVLEPYILNDVIDIEYGEKDFINEKEYIKASVQGNMLIFLKLHDKNGNKIFIAPPFFGLSSSGIANYDVRSHDYEYNLISRINLQCKQEQMLNVCNKKLVFAKLSFIPNENGLFLIKKYLNEDIPRAERLF